MGIVAATLIVVALGYFAIISIIPVNGDSPVFAAPTNIYIKSFKSPKDGYVFAAESTKGSRIALGGTHNPTYTVKEGNLVSIHFINEDAGIPNVSHQHNLNIDEFNVHSKDLNYFQSETITFLADKRGTFEYYSTIHPEMRGTIVVE